MTSSYGSHRPQAVSPRFPADSLLGAARRPGEVANLPFAQASAITGASMRVDAGVERTLA